jgi:BirA family biotin operon repressor/biotin-[acetyl-CoA-carboxylase] ligase
VALVGRRIGDFTDRKFAHASVVNRTAMLSTEGAVNDHGRQVVQQLLDNQWIRSARYLASTTSTNSIALDELKSMSIPAEYLPRLVLADQQTAGRGRQGRIWISNDQNLTFTLTVPRPQSPSTTERLSVAVGVGIANSLEAEFPGLQVQLKWPNDVYVSGGKLAGILLESTSGVPSLVVGVGVNVGSSPAVQATHAAAPIRCLSEQIGRSIDRYQFFPGLVGGILAAIELARAADPRLLSSFRHRCLLAGKSIQFVENGQTLTGFCHGIGDGGELIADVGGHTRHIHSGEVQLLRLQPEP